ncbi:ferritin-like domain-containing protein [Thalassomonas haliotis]|uniref:Ferritin-like protein n=1 Tax=Thalassomonas haliotis TaxID=485448 RepID=A0ABY7V9Q3_9GAMM|nr:ferritin-like domain-containing protein [Thalassomonas haliotis]WDE09955.1 ferritin-like protein [Thalassomonas haliotis]
MSLYHHLDISNAEELLQHGNLVIPKKVDKDQDWTLEQLQEHLQWAVDIELYTIPFYMAAMYSIKDQGSEARRLLRSVVNQEMLHMQCAANIANAYDTELVIRAPGYGGTVPHLNFALDTPNPTEIYSPYSTAIGPLDVERINTMCIIEYPNWQSCAREGNGSTEEYGSIGEFYQAVSQGARVLAEFIQGNVRQVGHFSALYPGVASMTITKDGKAGLAQVESLINLIVDQGEGLAEKKQYVKTKFQNRIDDLQPSWDHFEKFSYLREQALPETYPLGFGNDRSREVQQILLKHFGEFLVAMNTVFRGGEAPDFAAIMYKVGGAIAACWENGALPVFSKVSTSSGAQI